MSGNQITELKKLRSGVIAFKPRQVILAERQQPRKPQTMASKRETPLLHSVLLYLQKNHFNKSAVRLLKESNIQDHSWKDNALDLEDIFDKYLQSRDGKKKKKKKMALLDNNVTELDGRSKEEINLNIEESGNAVDVTNHKKNKQKKNRPVTGEITDTKDKKRKNKTITDPHTENSTSVCTTKKETKEKKSLESSEVGADNNQIAKKRKRSNENEVQPAKETTLKGSKRRKSEGLEVNEKQIGANGLDKKSLESTRLSSPKTVNAFQRVKIDDVEFVDDRLQDNSYWAKDGAEKGYGAKAQETLGQVKGRDFRHEKTKKKRGSYRGGQIDLDSHSIKFNYSNEE